MKDYFWFLHMYTITREQASELLGISTRSIDRYIKWGKLRSQKNGKIVYINKQDIDNLTGDGKNKHEIIIKDIKSSQETQTKPIVNNTHWINMIFDSLKREIKKKDEEINELHNKIGKMEEVVKNSISLVEFKKTQFLLEESRVSLSQELETTKKDLEKSTQQLQSEKNANIILLSMAFFLLLLVIIVWLIKI